MTSRPPTVEPVPPTQIRGHGENGPVNIVRSVAALAVVAEHAREVLMQDFDRVPHTAIETLLYGVSALGHQAVVVFFVLSGYWVGGSALRKLRRGSFRWPSYVIDRVTRLWIVLIPALVLTLVLDLIGRAAFGSMTTYTGDPRYAGTVILHQVIDPITFLGNALFFGSIHVHVLGSNAALWSLGYEFWMYLLVPLVVFAVIVLRRRSALYLLIAVILAVLVGSDVLWYMPIWGLGMGVAAAEPHIRTWLTRIGPRWVTAMRVLAILLLGGTALVVRAVNSLTPLVADYLVAVPAAVLLMTLVTGFQRERRPRFDVLARFSDLAASSYSLYAIHVPILVLLASVLGLQVESRWPADALHWLLLVVVIAGCAVIATGFARVTEAQTGTVRDAVKRLLLPSERARLKAQRAGGSQANS